jgi:hypothetical protein
MKYRVFFLVCLRVYKRKNKERNILITSIPFTVYLSFLKIGIKSVFHLHFIKGISVPPIFGRNALEGMEWTL